MFVTWSPKLTSLHSLKNTFAWLLKRSVALKLETFEASSTRFWPSALETVEPDKVLGRLWTGCRRAISDDNVIVVWINVLSSTNAAKDWAAIFRSTLNWTVIWQYNLISGFPRKKKPLYYDWQNTFLIEWTIFSFITDREPVWKESTKL